MKSRFQKYIVNPETGCWEWTGSVDKDGYGQIRWRSTTAKNGWTTIKAHRAIYQLVTRGPIPEGMELDHTCNTRKCVNPLHMVVCTHHANVQVIQQRWMGLATVEDEALYAMIFEVETEGQPLGIVADRYGLGKGELVSLRRSRRWEEMHKQMVISANAVVQAGLPF